MKLVHCLQSVAHGSLSPTDIGTGRRGATGSEQSMLYLARYSAALGHRVVVYLPTEQETTHDGVTYLDINREYPRLRELDSADVVVAWISGDMLVRCRKEQLRVHSIQVNDWLMNAAQDGQYETVDVFLCVSQAQQQWLWKAEHAPKDQDRIEIIPNGVDVGRFSAVRPRFRHRAIYCSSPDRGLHWLLYLWPDIRREYPDATLHIYYQLESWLHSASHLMSEIGLRARYVGDRIRALQGHGVVPVGAVSPVALADALLRADFMLYPCDPVSSTEGFGVAVLEACAAGCVPIITDADAFGEVYEGSGAIVIPRGDTRDWIDAYRAQILAAFADDALGEIHRRREAVQRFATQYDWSFVGKQFHAMLERRLAMKAHGGTGE